MGTALVSSEFGKTAALLVGINRGEIEPVDPDNEDVTDIIENTDD
jgi:hypothetical protein